MKRRKFLLSLAAVSAAGPKTRAQSSKPDPIVGFLGQRNPPPDRLIAGLEEQLSRLGRKVRFVVRLADGRLESVTEAAADLVRVGPDVIVAWLTPMVVAAKRATDKIPIVMGGAANPIENGLVESLARPGGNVTGISGQGAELAGKCVGILRESLPKTVRLGVLANGTDPFTAHMLARIELAARSAKFELIVAQRTEGEDMTETFASFVGSGVDAVLIQPTMTSSEVIRHTHVHRLPSISFIRPFIESGGLIAYTVQRQEHFRAVADYVDRILSGSNPAEMPVSQHRRFDLILNLNTARAIGVEFDPRVLDRADEIVQ